VKEEGVFWLGGKPGSRKATEATPEAAGIEPAILAACRAHGMEPENFVAALGAHGSWLVDFAGKTRRERIVWNGRERKLVLQRASRSGGWEDLRECPVASADGHAFSAGIALLLQQ
jgi:hypothetical protein